MNNSTIQPQSRLLTKFYIDINNWINGGRPEYTDCFCSSVGLCSNLVQWAQHNKLDFPTYTTLADEMKNQFTKAGLDARLPFNQSIDYDREKKYHNPYRIAWVRNHALYAHPVKMSNGVYEVHGGLYGKLHSTSGDIRTWKSYSGAYKAAQKYNVAHENYFIS